MSLKDALILVLRKAMFSRCVYLDFNQMITVNESCFINVFDRLIVMEKSIYTRNKDNFLHCSPP